MMSGVKPRRRWLDAIFGLKEGAHEPKTDHEEHAQPHLSGSGRDGTPKGRGDGGPDEHEGGGGETHDQQKRQTGDESRRQPQERAPHGEAAPMHEAEEKGGEDHIAQSEDPLQTRPWDRHRQKHHADHIRGGRLYDRLPGQARRRGHAPQICPDGDQDEGPKVARFADPMPDGGAEPGADDERASAHGEGAAGRRGRPNQAPDDAGDAGRTGNDGGPDRRTMEGCQPCTHGHGEAYTDEGQDEPGLR